jgi:hypothetical protein
VDSPGIRNSTPQYLYLKWDEFALREERGSNSRLCSNKF